MDREPGEHLIFEGHPSWRSIIDFYIKGILAVALIGVAIGVVTNLANDEVNTTLLTLVVLVLLVLVIVGGYVKRLFTTYTITNHRLHIRRGIIARTEQQTQINRVQNVNTHQSVLQRMLMIGDVDFDTAAGDDYEFRFAGVSAPSAVVEAVHRAQRDSDTAVTTGPPGGR